MDFIKKNSALILSLVWVLLPFPLLNLVVPIILVSQLLEIVPYLLSFYFPFFFDADRGSFDFSWLNMAWWTFSFSVFASAFWVRSLVIIFKSSKNLKEVPSKKGLMGASVEMVFMSIISAFFGLLAVSPSV